MMFKLLQNTFASQKMKEREGAWKIIKISLVSVSKSILCHILYFVLYVSLNKSQNELTFFYKKQGEQIVSFYHSKSLLLD